MLGSSFLLSILLSGPLGFDNLIAQALDFFQKGCIEGLVSYCLFRRETIQGELRQLRGTGERVKRLLGLCGMPGASGSV